MNTKKPILKWTLIITSIVVIAFIIAYLGLRQWTLQQHIEQIDWLGPKVEIKQTDKNEITLSNINYKHDFGPNSYIHMYAEQALLSYSPYALLNNPIKSAVIPELTVNVQATDPLSATFIPVMALANVAENIPKNGLNIEKLRIRERASSQQDFQTMIKGSLILTPTSHNMVSINGIFSLVDSKAEVRVVADYNKATNILSIDPSTFVSLDIMPGFGINVSGAILNPDKKMPPLRLRINESGIEFLEGDDQINIKADSVSIAGQQFTTNNISVNIAGNINPSNKHINISGYLTMSELKQQQHHIKQLRINIAELQYDNGYLSSQGDITMNGIKFNDNIPVLNATGPYAIIHNKLSAELNFTDEKKSLMGAFAFEHDINQQHGRSFIDVSSETQKIAGFSLENMMLNGEMYWQHSHKPNYYSELLQSNNIWLGEDLMVCRYDDAMSSSPLDQLFMVEQNALFPQDFRYYLSTNADQINKQYYASWYILDNIFVDSSQRLKQPWHMVPNINLTADTVSLNQSLLGTKLALWNKSVVDLIENKVDGQIEVNLASLRMMQDNTTLDHIQMDLPKISYKHGKLDIDGFYQIKQAKLKQLAKYNQGLSLAGKLKISNAQIESDLKFTDSNRYLLGFANIHHNLAEHNGYLKFNVNSVDFAKKPLIVNTSPSQSLKLTAGGISSKGELAWTIDKKQIQLTSHPSLAVQSHHLNLQADNVAINDINANLHFNKANDKGYINNQYIKIAEVNSENKLNNIQMDFALQPSIDKPKLHVNSLDFNLAQGHVSASNFNIDAKAENQFALQITQGNMNELFDFLKINDMRGTGKLSGLVTVILAENGLQVKHGELSNTDNGGHIQLANNNLNHSNYSEKLADVLQDFDYKQLHISLRQKNNKQQVQVALEGQNTRTHDGNQLAVNFTLDNHLLG